MLDLAASGHRRGSREVLICSKPDHSLEIPGGGGEQELLVGAAQASKADAVQGVVVLG